MIRTAYVTTGMFYATKKHATDNPDRTFCGLPISKVGAADFDTIHERFRCAKCAAAAARKGA